MTIAPPPLRIEILTGALGRAEPVAVRVVCVLSVIFIARRYASAVYAVVMCLRVCICLSHAGIVSKRLNLGSRSLCQMIDKGLWFSSGLSLRGDETSALPHLKLSTMVF